MNWLANGYVTTKRRLTTAVLRSTGYESKGVGKYRIENNEVEFYDTLYYTQDPTVGYHSTESQLVLQPKTATSPALESLRYFYSLRNNKTELSLAIDCPPYAICTSIGLLTRK
jgi:hypothetical protein